MTRRLVTADDIKQGNALFDGGASQAEVARTLGFGDSTIRRHFPGRGLSEEEISERIRIAQYERRLREAEAKENLGRATVRKGQL